MNSSGGYKRWIIIVLTIANQAITLGIAVFSFALFSIPWLEQYSISQSQLMLAIFIFQIMSGLASPFFGQMLDKMSLRFPVVFGFLLFGFGLGLLSVADAYWQVIAVYALIFSVSLILSGPFISQLLISRWFGASKGLALGLSATGSSLGGVLLPPLIALGLASYSLATILLYLSLFCLFFMAPLNFVILKMQSPIGTDPKSSADQALINQTWKTQSILTTAAFWIPLAILIPVNAAFSSVQFNLGVYLNDLSYPSSFTGQMIAVSATAMVIGKLLYGKLADHIDHRYLLLFVSLMNIGMLALLLTDPDKFQLLVAAVLLGVSAGGMLPLMGTIFVARFGTESFGKVMGLVMLFLVMGGVGPIYAGWLYDVFGSYDYAFISLIMLIIPGITILKWLPQPLARA